MPGESPRSQPWNAAATTRRTRSPDRGGRFPRNADGSLEVRIRPAPQHLAIVRNPARMPCFAELRKVVVS
jgi:hypothetical protein